MGDTESASRVQRYTWSPLFVSRLVFVLALGFSSAGSLVRYVTSFAPGARLLTAGSFFGMSLAGYIYVLLHLRKLQGPLSRREAMILWPLFLAIVAALTTRVLLLFR